MIKQTNSSEANLQKNPREKKNNHYYCKQKEKNNA